MGPHRVGRLTFFGERAVGQTPGNEHSRLTNVVSAYSTTPSEVLFERLARRKN
jgi:hypothetical protein